MNSSIIITSVALALVASGLPVDLTDRPNVGPLHPELVQWLKASPRCASKDSLSVTVDRIPDVTCPGGGKLVTVGTDQNDNRRLEMSEVEHVLDLCGDRQADQLETLRSDDLCLHMEVARALSFSYQLERALAPEHRATPLDLDLIDDLTRIPSDS